MSERGLRGCLVALVAWGAFYVFRTSFVVEGERVSCLWDDAMISMRYASNLAAGHGLVWNPGGERVQGFSNPAVTLAMAALHGLPIGPLRMALAFQCLALAALAATVWLAARTARALFPEQSAAGIAAALGTALCAPVCVWALQGADTVFVSLWLLGCSEAIARAGPRQWPDRLSVWLALGPLIRPDAAIFSAVFVAMSLAYPGPRRRRLVSAALPLGIAGAALLAFGWLYYGDPLPNTYYLKATGSPRALVLRAGVFQLGNWLPGLAPALVAAAFAVARRPRDPRLALLALLVVAGLFWAVWSGGDWLPRYGIRYAVPVLPLLLLLSAGGSAELASALARRARVPAAALPLVLLASAALGLAASPATVRTEWLDPRHETLLRAQNRLGFIQARYLRAHTLPDTSVAVHWAGVLPYFAERPALDVLGRADRHIARLHVERFFPGHAKWDWDYVLGVRRPDVILQLSRGLGEHPLLRQRYLLVEAPGAIEFHLRRTAIPRLADDRARFRDVATHLPIARRRHPVAAGSRAKPNPPAAQGAAPPPRGS